MSTQITARVWVGEMRGRPSIGADKRVIAAPCRVKPDTEAQLNAWLLDLRQTMPSASRGQLLDLMVELVQRRRLKIAGK